MRKNSPRHWLHATLDLLPVILIPVFMIYSHRHTINSYSVTRQERVNQPYNFYQGVKNGKPINTEFIETDNGSITYYPYFSDAVVLIDSNNSEDITITFETNIDIHNNDILYLTFDIWSLDFDNNGLGVYIDSLNNDFIVEEDMLLDSNSFINYTKYIDVEEQLNNNSDYNFKQFIFYIQFDEQGSFQFALKHIQIFNLTTIFGSGNEPTKDEFESMLIQDYYNYGNNYFDNFVTISKAYNDTDIMSQFTYNLYNSVDKYFNMNNVFGMNNVYTWFETNIFHGTAPLYIYIVWNIILYEFVMDLLFLLYALFMWFVDVTKRLVEKPLDSIK